MSVCITAGFATRKKYVGGIYACDGTDLPATQDFGTVQFSGPFVSAQTVPATEVIYTIIGKTPCGDDIRRIKTRTYSSRGAPGKRVTDGATFAAIVGGGLYYGRPTIGIGVTEIDAYNSIYYQLLGITPQSGNGYHYENTYTSTYDGTGFSPEPPIGTVCLKGDIYRDSPPGLFAANANLIIPVMVTGTIQNVTIYYLDVNEVWTYDLV